MIIFWRLLLTYYICAVLFYNQQFFKWYTKRPATAEYTQGIVFALIAGLLCKNYLQTDWQLAELWYMPGWVGVLVTTAFYMLVNKLFIYRSDYTRNYTAIFLAYNISMWLALFVCSPLHMVYKTGNLMAESPTVFFVGLLVITKMFSVFIYMVEKDLYGRDFPTLDESFITMLMRLIFFLIVLLPGWRWVLWFAVWVYVCGEAHQNRLMDLSRFALYFSMFGATAVGFLVRYSWYWI